MGSAKAVLSPVSEKPSAPGHPYPSPRYAWYVVAVLYLASTLSFLDRQILNYLVRPIRSDFQIDDFQFSLIQGLAFAVLYTVFGIPLGRWADSTNRRGLVTAGIAVWSCMTALCGLAANFWQLFLARVGVGFGEASLAPSAYSLIADYFPREKRSLPLNVYAGGVMFGSGLANLFGGLVAQFALRGGAQGMFLLGGLKPWQLAFVLVSLPGILVVLLMATVKEPFRQEKRGKANFGATLRYMRLHWKTYSSLITGITFFGMINFSFMAWVPPWFDRRFGWTQAQIGPYFGGIIFFFGTLGLVAAGVLSGKFVRAGKKSVYSKLMIATQAIVIIPLALTQAVDDPYWVLGCIAFIIFCTSFPLGLGPAALQSVTPNEMRGQVISAYLFVLSLLAVTLGPMAVGALTSYVFHDDTAVRFSAVIVGIGAAILGIVTMGLGMRAYARTAEAIAR